MDVHEFDELNEAAVKGWGEPYFTDDTVTLWHGDALEVLSDLPDQSVDCCVTSPPYYGLRDYGTEGQYGLEGSPAAYVETMRTLFAEVRRVLADDGTLWLNIGDSYAANGLLSYNNQPNKSRDFRRGSAAQSIGAGINGKGIKRTDGIPAKNLLGIPWRVAFALQDDGWILRNDIIWAKPNAMPESVTDRLSTKHEHLFMLAKSARYWFDLDAVREPHASSPDEYRSAAESNQKPTHYLQAAALLDQHRGFKNGQNPLGRNPGDVWSIPTQPYPGAHFAVMPQTLASRCIEAGCKPGGTVLDPFSGSGTTGLAAAKHGRKYVGIDLNAEYLQLSLDTRLVQPGLIFDE